jgi:hypothetical protein
MFLRVHAYKNQHKCKNVSEIFLQLIFFGKCLSKNGFLNVNNVLELIDACYDNC